jgi:precorrin-6A synthase
VVGIGPGDPELLTLQGAAALAALDVAFVLDKGDELDDLAALRRLLLARHARPDLAVVTVDDPPRLLSDRDYDAAVARWHGERVAVLRDAVVGALDGGGTGGFLVWGDPSLYDSTLRILDDLTPTLPWPVAVEVLPGVSSLHLLTARFGIPLNRVGAEVRLTTGRRLLEAPPDEAGDVVVFLDPRCRFAELPDQLPLDLYWAAYLGTSDELLVSGPLAAVRDEVVARRAEARSRKGWMFDTYLLRWRG